MEVKCGMFDADGNILKELQGFRAEDGSLSIVLDEPIYIDDYAETTLGFCEIDSATYYSMYPFNRPTLTETRPNP